MLMAGNASGPENLRQPHFPSESIQGWTGLCGSYDYRTQFRNPKWIVLSVSPVYTPDLRPALVQFYVLFKLIRILAEGGQGDV